jgi:ribosome-binding protein aMBF1 (putative translation factor)
LDTTEWYILKSITPYISPVHLERRVRKLREKKLTKRFLYTNSYENNTYYNNYNDMKTTSKNTRSTKDTRKKEWHSFEDVFEKSSKTKQFQLAYNEERVRLELARQIKENRVKHKLTQKVVAERAHIPQSVIARIESGKHGFTFGTLARVATALDKKVVLV